MNNNRGNFHNNKRNFMRNNGPPQTPRPQPPQQQQQNQGNTERVMKSSSHSRKLQAHDVIIGGIIDKLGGQEFIDGLVRDDNKKYRDYVLGGCNLGYKYHVFYFSHHYTNEV